jgi:hypothetical protein
MMKKPLIIFFATALILLVIFFVFPINLFDGAVVRQNGLQEYIEYRPLSLACFIGIGIDEADMANVKDYYLTTKGWFMAFIFTLGLPALLAYRVHLKSTLSKDEKK